MRVSSHPAQVVTPNKEGSSFFLLNKVKKKNPTKNYSLLKLPVKTNFSLIHFSFDF